MKVRSSLKIRTEIETTLGFFPPFFAPALTTPAILENLWQQTLNSYIENPLPALFKEKLASLLARYCTVPYCLICHSSALLPLGMNASEVLNMLEAPPLGFEELAEKTKCLDSTPIQHWPEPGSELEECILYCCVAIFLNQDTELCHQKLRHLLGETDYGYLVLFLAYNRTSLSWAEAHPELSYEIDQRVLDNYQPLINQEPGLGDFFKNYQGKIKEQGDRRTFWLTQETKTLLAQERKLRLQTETALNENAAILNAADDGIYGLTLEGNCTFANASAARMLGYKIEELLNKNMHLLVHHTHEDGTCYEEHDCPLLKVMKTGVAYSEDVDPLWRRDGTMFRTEYSASPIIINGQITGAVVSFRDITARRLAELTEKNLLKDQVLARLELENNKLELLEALDNLKQEQDLREKFVAALSHDLRTPLSAAKMSAQILSRKVPDELQRLTARISSNMDRADNMIRDLLDASRVKVGEKLQLDIVECDLNSITQSTLEDLSTIHGDRFQIKADEDIIGFWDSLAIRRMIENLVNNAVKYGSVEAQVTVALVCEQQMVKIKVHNFGNSISAHEIDEIFKPYQRSATAFKSQQKGWGIGLTLVRGFAEAHGGSIDVSSSEEEGTTFSIVLPQNARTPADV